MNLVEVWIEDMIKTEDVVVNGVKKIRVYFNTVCWGSHSVESRIFDNLEAWEKFKARRYYLG